jgi:pyruvate dehydrogenase E2 component (dihydrolipoamide acetyltransferase)
MSVSVTMPRLGESVSEGTVTRWLKKEGERVEADEPLLEVSTDKVDTEIPAPAAGVVQSIKVNEDETVDVGVELAVIDEGGTAGGSAGEAASDSADTPAAQPGAEPAAEPAAESAPAAEPESAEPAAEDTAPVAAATPAPAPASEDQSATGADGFEGGATYVTPLVRRLAAEHRVDLAAVRGTGVGGRVRKQDVLDAAKAGSDQLAPAPAQAPAPAAPAPAAPAAADGQRATAAAEPAREIPTQQPRQPTAGRAPATVDQAKASTDPTVRGRTEKLSRLRTVIAARMVESLQISAQLTTVVEADVTKIARLRALAKETFEAREGVKLSFLPFFAIAAVEALRAHPTVNASIDIEAGTVTYHDAEHLGIAVDTERGLLVPVIHDAGDLNLGGMARKIADLAERTRNSQVTPDELGGGTFTLTNTGSRGALFDTPIINQPQVGILGTGSVVKRPAVVSDPELGEVIAVRSTAYLALTYDHRIVDGAGAARFLNTVRDRLEGGSFEADLGL